MTFIAAKLLPSSHSFVNETNGPLVWKVIARSYTLLPVLYSIHLKGEDKVAWDRVLALSGRGGEFTQPSRHLLAECCTYRSESTLI